MHTIITLEPESELQKKINEDICSICLVEFDNQCSDTIIVPCCKNKFHNICYNSWIINNPTCPLCRNIDIPILITKSINHNSHIQYILPSQVYPNDYNINNINNNNDEIVIINSDETNISICRFNYRIRICLMIIACIIGICSLFYAIGFNLFRKS